MLLRGKIKMNDFKWDSEVWKQKPCVFVPTVIENVRKMIDVYYKN